MSTKISGSLFNGLCFIGGVLITPLIATAETWKGANTKRRDPFAKLKKGPNRTDSEKAPEITKASRKDRQSMIAEAAYYRAEQRNFQGGNTIEDWLAAEKEVDEKLAKKNQ